jgi:hypothetical protein
VRACTEPARDGLALLSGLKSFIAGIREPREAGQPKESREPHDDLFIG